MPVKQIISKGNFKVWRMYVKHLMAQNPDKSLKWLLKVYHRTHPEKYEEFKKSKKADV